MSEKTRKELEEILNDPMFDYITEKSVKQFMEVTHDVFPDKTREERIKYLELWEREDTPKTFYQKLMAKR